MKTIFRTPRNVRKPAIGIIWLTNDGPQRPTTGDRHDQSCFSHRYCRRLLPPPSASPRVLPHSRSIAIPQSAAKGDRLDIRRLAADCSQQAWPNFEASCLRVAGKNAVFDQGSPAGNRRPHALRAASPDQTKSRLIATPRSQNWPSIAPLSPAARYPLGGSSSDRRSRPNLTGSNALPLAATIARLAFVYGASGPVPLLAGLKRVEGTGADAP